MHSHTYTWGANQFMVSVIMFSDHSSSKHYVLQTYLYAKLPGIVTIYSDLREWKFDELHSSHSDQLYSHSPLPREETK